MINLYDLPALNAAFNAASFGALLIALVQIRRGRRLAHRICIFTALFFSACFLAGYLIYHAQVGHVVFPAEGAVRAGYLVLLISHSVLAALVLPALGFAVHAAIRQRFERHRRIGKVLMGAWCYVCVSGVFLYFVLLPHLPTAPQP